MDEQAWEREFAGRDRTPEHRDRSPGPREQLPAARDRLPGDRLPGDRLPAGQDEGPAGVTQIHEPGALPVDPAFPLRQAAWELLPQEVRAKTLEKAGRTLLWWARVYTDRAPFALVLGDRGLCRVEPVYRDGRAAEHRGERARVEPGSLVSRSFDGRPRQTGGAGSGGAAAPGRPGAPVERLVLDPPDAQGVLGHFPLDVQDFLQRPFLAGPRAVTAEWYYEETAEPGHTDLFVLLCLSTDRHVTAVEARRTLDRGATPDRARWHAITCHRARLTPR
ncbi:hypothetical protein CP980_29755 [Streptomyces vinaceus]|uniref:Uncharacterized protein n=1 Tax=Streptomyces vinaceus TaxID=1960 RepID=A0A5J6JMM1_STRVI|nr:hypothetical protein [Streptomyces vinaceus]QEV48708.1 hypothetical protein CP980_29755 [Streptomyces vinaceus]GHE36659.1 hypothetical protein GCM10017778_19700 [Streptomyces vinaceus]